MVLLYLALVAGFAATFAHADGDGWQPDTTWFLPADDGYVAFGDSFAAGMGTGATSTDSCRVGEYAYTKLLNYFKKGGVDQQSYVCSGDTQTGLNRQVDEWLKKISTTDKSADLVTVSIGGNDLGFGPIVDSCLVWASPSRGPDDCKNNKQKALDALADTTASGLKFNIKETLLKILQAGKNDKAHIYLTGYVAFFNEDTTTCDKTTFYYWNPNHGGGDGPELTQDLRKEMNGFVIKLNQFLSGIADEINTQFDPYKRITFVDPNANFDTHRWCEVDDGVEVVEPVEDRKKTWFFLSGWKDVGLREEGSASAVDGPDEVNSDEFKIDLKKVMDDGEIKLPDPSTCSDGTVSQGQPPDQDPVERFYCEMAKAAAVQDSDAAKELALANQEIKDGGVTTDHIHWYLPTSSIKTFHPRSAGHWQGYLRSIYDAMQDRAQHMPTDQQITDGIANSHTHSIFAPPGHHSQGEENDKVKRGVPQTWWA